MNEPNTLDDDEPQQAQDLTGGTARLAGAGRPDEDAAQPPAPTEPAEVPFTERYRLSVGLVAAAVCVAVAVFFAVVGPASAVEPGAFGLIMRWGTPVLWGLLAVAAITWAVRMPRRLTHGLASVVLVAYLVYLIARSL